jgi:hypothetical protein
MIRHTSPALPAALLVAALAPAPVRADDGDFVVWQAYNVKFEIEPARIVLLASTYTLNPTARDYRDLTFTGRAPAGFDLALAGEEIQEASRRPEGFHEEIVDGTYRMKQPYLGAGQACTIFYQLSWTVPPPDLVSFPGLQIDYSAGDEARTFRALDEQNSLARLRRFAGTLTDFIKRNADLSLSLDGPGASEWTFTALDYRAFGRNPNGIIDIEGTPEGSGHFRVQAGYPGDFREILVRWEPKTRGRKDPITLEFARQELDTMIRWVGDFSLDAASLQSSAVKVARYPAALVSGRWVDNKRNRLGSGLFRLYIVNDPSSHRDIYLYLGVQGRGIGPEHADVPAPEKEAALMEQLLPLVEKFRP